VDFFDRHLVVTTLPLKLLLKVLNLLLEFAVQILHYLDLLRILRFGVVLKPIPLLLRSLQALLQQLKFLLKGRAAQLQIQLELLVALGKLSNFLVTVVQLRLEGLLK